MKFVVTGGLGYVGSRLSQYLAKNGHEVIALSRQAHSLTFRQWPIGLKVAHPQDFLQPEKLMGVDVLIHLASLNEHECLQSPAEAVDVNIRQTLSWVEAARQAGVGQVIFFSTAHVYAKPLVGVFSEDSPVHPLHPYAITHLCAEQFVESYAEGNAMNAVIFRLTNAFGPPAFPTANRWTLLVNDLCRMAIKKGEMQLHSDGTQLRDFICLHDVCRAVAWAAENRITGRFNLGSGQSRTVWSMAVAIQLMAEKILQRKIVLARQRPGPGTAQALSINTSRLQSAGFRCVGLEDEEIAGTLHYFIQNP